MRRPQFRSSLPPSGHSTVRLLVEELESRNLLSTLGLEVGPTVPCGCHAFAAPLAMEIVPWTCGAAKACHPSGDQGSPDQALGLEDVVAQPALGFTPQAVNTSVIGLHPAQVKRAYGFDRIAFANGWVPGDGFGQTIAIVAAYDHPHIEEDLKVFSQTFGLPDPPFFVKATPQGEPDQVDPKWALEIALDVQWAHAIAPRANILLVEAVNGGMGSLLNAVNYARQQPGVTVVSMSWGSPEFSAETYYDLYLTTPLGHAPITFVASSGDYAAYSGPLWPAASPNVLAVGGTTLWMTPYGTYGGEVGWTNSTGGFSRFEPKPAFQKNGGFSFTRTTPDVALNGDPFTGYAVYSTVPYNGQSGWFRVGGTSATAPQWAGLVAIANQGRAIVGRPSLGNAQAAVYGLPANAFHDVMFGSNGFRAVPGYDLVTGRGTPFADRVVAGLVGGAPKPTLPGFALPFAFLPNVWALPHAAAEPQTELFGSEFALPDGSHPPFAFRSPDKPVGQPALDEPSHRAEAHVGSGADAWFGQTVSSEWRLTEPREDQQFPWQDELLSLALSSLRGSAAVDSCF